MQLLALVTLATSLITIISAKCDQPAYRCTNADKEEGDVDFLTGTCCQKIDLWTRQKSEDRMQILVQIEMRERGKRALKYSPSRGKFRTEAKDLSDVCGCGDPLLEFCEIWDTREPTEMFKKCCENGLDTGDGSEGWTWTKC